ncbi:MAG: ATP-binding cassette domain-containing protein [Actinobacteria bacterium]|nr:MAG: ATP-binding cassette domain-containing protein [Actinomycetota bacterium]
MIGTISVPAATLVQGLILGLNYGLLALGLVLVYRTSRVLNFAHGELGVVAAVLLAKLVNDYHISYWPALVLCLAVGAGVGGLSELALRRLFDRPRLLVMVATIGLEQILFVATLLPFVRPKHLFGSYPVPIHAHFTVGGERFLPGDTFTLIVAPIVVAAFAIFFIRSAYGLAMRAMAENGESARLAGIWIKRTSTLAWMLAGLLSAVTAILASPGRANAFSQALGPELLLRALAAALIGAMTSFVVAFLAGIGLGVLESVLVWNVRQASTVEVAMFVVLLIALLLRVRALRKGSRAEERSAWSFGSSVIRVTGNAARERLRRGALVGAGILALVLPAVLDNSRAFLVSRIFVFAVIAVSLTILTGWAGQLSLGHFALVAIGAVVTARLVDHVNLVLLLPLAGLISAAVAIVVGLPALRIRGLYLAVTTLGLALLMQVAVLATPCARIPLFGWHACTGLPDPASTLIRRPRLLGVDLGPQHTMYYFVLGVLALTLLVARVWRDHGVARDLLAVRDNEVGAAATGVRVVRAKLMAFALSGFLAGVAGVCFALVTERFKASTFDPSQSILVVAMVIIGGLGSIEGAVLGALYLVGIPAAFGSGPTVQFITSGVGLTIFILFLPGDAVSAGLQDRSAGPARMTAPAVQPVRDATRPRGGETELPRTPAGLEVYDLVVAFGGLLAVNGVDLSIQPGSTVGILGPNGSGKTTLLDAVSGLLRPASGLVHLDGVDLVDYLPEDRAALGVVRSFQDCRLYPELTVEDTLMVAEDARRPLGVLSSTLRLPAARRAENDKRQTVDEVLDAFGLEPFRHRRIDQLSTGTRRVVDLAAAARRAHRGDRPTRGRGVRTAHPRPAGPHRHDHRDRRARRSPDGVGVRFPGCHGGRTRRQRRSDGDGAGRPRGPGRIPRGERGGPGPVGTRSPTGRLTLLS